MGQLPFGDVSSSHSGKKNEALKAGPELMAFGKPLFKRSGRSYLAGRRAATSIQDIGGGSARFSGQATK